MTIRRLSIWTMLCSVLLLAACGGGSGRGGTDLVVTATGPADEVAGGASVVFTMTVTNQGENKAEDVTITNTVGNQLVLSTIVCTASGGATCPAETSVSMAFDTIPEGGKLVFEVTATVAPTGTGTVSNTMTANFDDEVNRDDNSATATATVAPLVVDLGVTQTGEEQVAAGSDAVFTAQITNPGPATANNLNIQWTHTGPADATFDPPTCTASAGATCPETLGPTMTVPSLAVGRTLSFSFVVHTTAATRGAIVNTVAITADEDQIATNNSASTTTTAVDARNGSYKVFAADGRPYDLSVDFDAGSYTMTSATGQAVARSFTLDASGDFVVSGNARLRAATDLLVGGHDFGAGVLPFVAARRFATNLGELSGLYNLVTRDLPTGGTPQTRAATARASGNTLQLCQSDTAVSPPQTCDPAALKSYDLSLAGDVYTAVSTSGGEALSFRLARVGASNVLLGAGPVTVPAAGDQLRIGLPDSAGLAGGTLRGPASSGDWGVTTLTASTWAYTGSAGSDSATLARVGSGGPFSMLTGPRLSDGASIFVMQAAPLAVTFGGFGGAASGLLQVALP